MLRSIVPLLLVPPLAGCAGPDRAGRTASWDTGAAPSCDAWTFDRAPTTWALPAGAPPGAFARTTRDAPDCDAGLDALQLFDLTGDGRPDLVVLADCDDPAVGTTTWRVWPGAAGGFGDEVTWPLPDGYGAAAFGALRSAADCTGDGDLPAYRYDDLDGDGAIDLVVTESCADPTLAAGAWRVYANTGAGFGPGVLRPLSVDFSAGAFVAPRPEVSCVLESNGLPAWGVVDLDGDGPADIVLTDRCRDDVVGVQRWDRLVNDGAAFSAAPVPWAIPPELQATTLSRDVGLCGAGLPDYFLLDLAGDSLPDLVVPRPCASTSSDWGVHANEGDGFAAASVLYTGPWSVNFLIDRPEQRSPNCAEGIHAWVLDDADGDGDTDLTFTADCEDVTVGDSHWAFYAGARGGWDDAVPVPLPTGYARGSFLGGRGDITGCGGSVNRPAWIRQDLDGDGVSEIVVTESCDDPSVGTTAWRVYGMVCAEG